MIERMPADKRKGVVVLQFHHAEFLAYGNRSASVMQAPCTGIIGYPHAMPDLC